MALSGGRRVVGDGDCEARNGDREVGDREVGDREVGDGEVGDGDPDTRNGDRELGGSDREVRGPASLTDAEDESVCAASVEQGAI